MQKPVGWFPVCNVADRVLACILTGVQFTQGCGFNPFAGKSPSGRFWKRFFGRNCLGMDLKPDCNS